MVAPGASADSSTFVPFLVQALNNAGGQNFSHYKQDGPFAKCCIR